MESKVTIQDWLEGARLRTLPAAAAPVFMGAGAAAHLGGFSLGKSLLALAVALALQVGVNFANDYSDGVKGTDENRIGPTRLTASGIVAPKRVLLIALANFTIAAIAGIILVVWSQSWWMLAVGVLAIGAAWFYTGGKKPYGYLGIGLSELMVFVFFGLVSTLGTTWTQTATAPAWLWVCASGIGLASVALLLVNNIRDIATDKLVGKTTLTVRLGDRWSRILYVVTILLSVLCAAFGQTNLWLGIGIGAVLLIAALPGIVSLMRGATGMSLLGTLRNTGLFALAYGILTGIALAIS